LGSTYINGGILQLGVLGGNQGIPNSSAVIVNGGTLDITSNNTTVAAVTLAGGGSITGTSGILTGSSYNMQDGTVSVKLAGGATVTLTKSTGGTVTLSNTNTYSGATVISAGTLALGANGSISNTPSISIAAGATNDVSAIAAYTLSGNTALSASGTSAAAAVLKGGTTVDLGTRPVSLAFTPTTFTGDSTHPALVVAQGGLTLNGQVTVINNGASPLGAGTYTLLSQASGSISGTPTLNAVIGGQGMDPMGTATLSVSGGNLNMIVSVPAYSFSWINSASGDWSGANWLDNLGATAGPAAGGRTNYWLNFNQADTYTANNDFGTLLLNRINFGGASVTLTGNSLTFTNGGVVGPMINQNSSVSVTVSNSLALNNNLTLGGSGGGLITLAGVVSGASSLTKTSPGMLMLSANNTFTGQTYLNNGTMVISTNSALGAITTGATLNMSNATLQTTATLALDNAGANKRNVVLAGTNVFDTGANALTISGTVSGTGGGLTKTGAGTMTLSVNATYTGPTTVNQ
ncbi:MAG: autotransporter-associated beta strand repeat-containing protein, partial [Lentisphaerota bacterium]